MTGDLLNSADRTLPVVLLHVHGEYLVSIFWGDCLDSFYMFWLPVTTTGVKIQYHSEV